jgi:pimeloyl-ACP methyl ester carboxylesterase
METTMVNRNPLRASLLSAPWLRERKLKLNGISTAVIEGGKGAPLVLLHGAGSFAAAWLRVLPELVQSHRVIAPDLPGHGESTFWAGAPDRALLSGWVDDLIDCTCEEAPMLVGQTLGGAIAAGYAGEHSERLAALVLADALGLEDFKPTPEFGSALQGYLSAPSTETYGQLMRYCLYDLPRVERELGDSWPPFHAYLLDRALGEDRIAALRALMQVAGMAALPSVVLGSIKVPTTLIWGRQDRATPLAVAERASRRYGWPLHVVEDAGDEVAFEQPEAFLAALRCAVAPARVRMLAT